MNKPNYMIIRNNANIRIKSYSLDYSIIYFMYTPFIVYRIRITFCRVKLTYMYVHMHAPS